MTASDTKLIVDNAEYAGWTDVTVTRSMESASGGFDLSLTSAWPGQTRDFPLRTGQACRVVIGSDTVISGYIDWLVITSDAYEHRLQVSGRDRAGDLVDCSATHEPGEWRGLPLLDLVRRLVQPWGMSVAATFTDATPFDVFRLQAGETAWEAIDRACRFRRALVMSNGQGGLTLTRAATTRAEVDLVLGQNIERCVADYDNSNRYSNIIVLGQRPAADSEDLASAFHGRGVASDAAVGRYRPLVILAEDQATQAQLQARAEWEAAVRFGRSRKIEVTVTGWRQKPTGRLWRPNEIVHVTDAEAYLDDDLLIAGVELRTSPEVAILTLYPPEAFAPDPPPAEAPGP